MPRKNKNAAQAEETAPSNIGVEAYYDDPKGRGVGFYIGIAIAAIAVLAAVLIGLYFFMNSTQIKPESYRSGLFGQLDGKTKEEIQAELDKIVEDGMFNIAIASVVDLKNGSSEGDFSIENSPANKYNMNVILNRADTGEQILETGIMEPNTHIRYTTLDKPLPQGTYNVIATFHAIDPEDDTKEIGQASCSMTIVVRS